MNELSDTIHNKIQNACTQGDKLAQNGKYKEAIEEYNKAWKVVPEPKNKWEASTWILAAIADACFLAGFYQSAKEALKYAMTCPDAVGNPFLHLRFGQVLFESNELDAAADELMRAYMGDGHVVFEDQDPKYLAFLKSRAHI